MNLSISPARVSLLPCRSSNFAGPVRFGLLGALAFGVVLATPRTAAKAGPNVTIDEQPVQVEVTNELPVPVEVVSNASKTPYYLQLGSYIEAGSNGEGSQMALVPEGKRFVVESITGFVRTPAGQYPSVRLVLAKRTGAPADAHQGEVSLLVQPQGTFNVGGPATFWIGTHAVKLQIDSDRNAIEAFAFRSATTGDALFYVNLLGYLEDL